MTLSAEKQRMIVLYTDFGLDDPYVGQLKAALLRDARRAVPIIDLLHRAPDFDPRAGAHLLAALQAAFDPGSVFLAVVDPGVGSDRPAVVLEADGKYYVGPDNGLLALVAARAQARRVAHRLATRRSVGFVPWPRPVRAHRRPGRRRRLAGGSAL